MDIFTLEPTDDTYTFGEIVDGLDTKLWVERYQIPGEFKFVCHPTKAIRSQLDFGTLISHTNTRSVMMVEDHEIKESKGQEPELTITGRTLDSFLGQRVATDDDQGFDPPLADDRARPYEINNVFPWEQAVLLIYRQIQNNPDGRTSFEIPNVHVTSDIDLYELPPSPGPGDWWGQEDKETKRQYLWPAIQDILDEFNGGIRIERPVVGGHDTIWFVVYNGVTQNVQFTYDSGDLETSRYFWSNRDQKNAAYVAAQYHGIYYAQSGFTGFNRRVAYIEANDLNVNPGEAGWAGPSELAKLENMMERRAKRKLAKSKKRTHIVEATIAPDSHYLYRRDYNMGDIVFVEGNFDTRSRMRVVEFAETEDESGYVGIPTLARPNDDAA